MIQSIMQFYSVVILLALPLSCGTSPDAVQEPASPGKVSSDIALPPKPAEDSQAEVIAKVDIARIRMERLEQAYNYWEFGIEQPFPESILELRKFSKFDEVVDPWGEQFILACSAELSPEFGVISKGPDRVLNTADDINSRDAYLLSEDARRIAEAVQGQAAEDIEFCEFTYSDFDTELNCWKEVDLEVLVKFPRLNSLELSSRALKDISIVSRLPNLTKLNLSFSGVEDLIELADLTQLRELKLQSTKVEDLSPLADLVQLRKLDFSGTSVSNVDSLRALVNLRELTLTNTQVKDLAPLATLTSLEHLNLARCKNISEIGSLASLQKLEYLNLTLTQVRDLRPLASMHQLRTLHISGTQVTDLSPLEKLSNLKELTIRNTIAESEIQKLRASMPALEISVTR